ncbi:MAG TPA: hypothetical protein VFE77_14385 [Rhodanobacter sp.]|nr:hypothetical protein [Rhodanobacter sp.]
MSSLWKDLLFLHGYLARKEDLLWCDQTNSESPDETPVASTTDKDGTAAKDGAKPSKGCASHWPRLAAPR